MEELTKSPSKKLLNVPEIHGHELSLDVVVVGIFQLIIMLKIAMESLMHLQDLIEVLITLDVQLQMQEFLDQEFHIIMTSIKMKNG
jgi:hypothetical protein